MPARLLDGPGAEVGFTSHPFVMDALARRPLDVKSPRVPVAWVRSLPVVADTKLTIPAAEPVTMLLVGAGLFAIGVPRNKRRPRTMPGVRH